MSTNSHVARRKNSFNIAVEPPFYSGLKDGLFLTGARGTVCLENVQLSGGGPNYTANAVVRDGSGIVINSSPITITVSDVTSVYNALGLTTGSGYQVSIPIDVTFRHSFEKVPTVELTPQNDAGGSLVFPVPTLGNVVLNNAVFAVRGDATVDGFTSSSIVSILSEGANPAAAANAVINQLLNTFCLHIHASAETRVL